MADTYISTALALKADFEERLSEKDDSKTLDALYRLIQNLIDTGCGKEAAEYQLRAAHIALSSSQIRDGEKIGILSSVADFICHEGMYSQALIISKAALMLAEEKFPDDEQLVYEQLAQFSDILGMAGISKQAEVYTLRAIEKAKRLYGEESLEVAECRLSLARTYMDTGKLDPALRELETSLEISKNNLDASVSMIADVLSSIARAQFMKGNEIEATRNIDRALDYLEDYEWDDDLRVGILLDAVDLYLGMDSVQKARCTLEEVIEIEENLKFDRDEIADLRKLLEDIRKREEER